MIEIIHHNISLTYCVILLGISLICISYVMLLSRISHWLDNTLVK